MRGRRGSILPEQGSQSVCHGGGAGARRPDRYRWRGASFGVVDGVNERLHPVVVAKKKALQVQGFFFA